MTENSAYMLGWGGVSTLEWSTGAWGCCSVDADRPEEWDGRNSSKTNLGSASLMENLHAAVWAGGRLERKQTCRKEVMMVLWDKKLNMVQ